jgi:hypothetical protein
MERMLLVLKRSPEQEMALDALLDQQQDSSSATYHQWLTPDQFGQQFGPSDQDVQAITDWLRSHGFQVARVSRGRTSIEFSGTASQVQEAFHTAIRRYSVNGEDHWANSSDPQIPSALTSVVAGINTLHNFPREAMHHVVGLASRSKANGEVSLARPSLYNLGGTCGVPGVGCHAVGPFDFATIYNLLPLWNAAPTHIDGTGQTIAVVGESDINPQDVAAFRDYFGLPAANLQIIVDGPDPGIVPGDETESDLDVEWAGAIAPNAKIDFVTSESTETSLGVDLSAQYIVDNNLAPVLSESYGVCELFLGTAGNQFYNQLWQQAAAQGITVLVATGDSGSAVCDQTAGSSGAAQFGLSVSGFSSTPYNVAVGGTDFNDLTNPSIYWAPTNSAPPLPGNPSALATVSALSYIPETTWNDTCTNGVFGTILGFSTNPETNCNNSQLISAGFLTTVAGSGGKSSCTNSDGQSLSSCAGGYTKPTWQTGTGVPNDGRRDVPDVSLYAAINSPSGSFYVVCEADFNPGMVSCDPTTLNTNFLGVGGTSASTPALAGIIALVNQETQSRQGNANYVLYKLATQQPAAFHDAPAGGTIAMPCVTGSTPDCITSLPGDKNGVLSGYSTSTGYDLATGLGSVDANNLVTKWSTVTSGTKATATSLTLSPAASPIPHGTAVPVNISVTPIPSSSSTPTGQVSLIASTGQSAGNFTLASNGSLTPGTTTNLLPGGSYTVTAHYAGDGIFAPSDSGPPVSVTVASEASTTFANLVTLDINGNPTSFSSNGGTLGSGVFLLRVDVGDLGASISPSTGISSNCSKGISSCASGTITLTSNGAPLPGGTLRLNSRGYAEVQLLAAGSYAVSASYSGDSSYGPGTGSANFTLSKAMTTTFASGTGSDPVPYGRFAQIGATIQTTSTGGAPTGTVSFFLDESPLVGGTPVSYEGFPYEPNHVPPQFATLSAVAGIDESSLVSVGNHVLTARYSGDANYAGSTSGPATLVIAKGQPSFLSFGANPSTLNTGQQTILSAQMIGVGGGVAPTGTMTFLVDNTLVSGTVTYTTNANQFGATILYTPTVTGTHGITVQYSGDANYLPLTTTGAASLSFTGPTFSVTANPTAIVASAPGQAGSTLLTFTSQNGLAGTNMTVSAACSGLPSESTCSFSPTGAVTSTAINLAANGSTTATFYILTTAPSAAAPKTKTPPDRREPWTMRDVIASAGALCIVMLIQSFRRRRFRWSTAFALLAFAFVLATAACGGGSSSGGGGGTGGGGGGGGNPGTPITQNAPITVSITIGGISQSVPNLTVTVQ